MSDVVVVLEPVEPGVTPSYCAHGKATCASCERWVWLGDKTYEVVASGQADPLCVPCAVVYLKPTSRRLGNISDHR